MKVQNMTENSWKILSVRNMVKIANIISYT